MNEELPTKKPSGERRQSRGGCWTPHRSHAPIRRLIRPAPAWPNQASAG